LWIGIRRPGQLGAALGFLVVIALAVGIAVYIQVASYTSIPFWDFWDELRTVQTAFAGKLGLHDLFAQHNEHRILLSRIQFIADYWLFGGRLVFLLAMLLISSVFLALALAWPAARIWNDRTITLGFFALALTATLSPLGINNLTSPFQVGSVQVYTFAVAAIALAVCWLRGEHEVPGEPHILALVSIVTLGAASTYSNANGLVVWPVIVAVMWLRSVRRTSITVVAAAGAALTASYFWSYEPVAGHSSYSQSLEHPLGIARYVATFLGHPAVALGSVALQLTGALGIVILGAVVVLAYKDRRRPDNGPTLFGAAVGVFVLVTAFQTALGRLSFGIGQALSSRYAIASAVFWVGLAVGVAPAVSRRATVLWRTRSHRINVTGLAFVSACVTASLAVNLVALPSAQELQAIRTQSEPMLVAFTAGVEDDVASSASYLVPGAVLPQLEWLRAEKKGPWSTGLGEALSTAQRRVPRPGTLPPCKGSVDSVTPVHGGQRLNGWIVPPPGDTASNKLDVVGPSGSPEGVGLVDLYRPDVKAAGASSSSFRGFVAYDRSAKPAADLVLLAENSRTPLCALPIPRSG
jgi:hypothetical protein